MSGQKRDVSWDGSPADLRAILGVPEDAYRDWTDLRRRVLDAAIAEVNQLAPFVVSIPERGGIKRQGRKVLWIRLEFWEKQDADKEAAVRELGRSRVGRKARRRGTVETIAQEARSKPRQITDIYRRRKGWNAAMVDEPINLVLDLLLTIRADVSEMRLDVREIKHSQNDMARQIAALRRELD